MIRSYEEQLVWLLEKSRQLVCTREVARLVKISIDMFLDITGAERAFFYVTDPDSGRQAVRLGRHANGDALGDPDSRLGTVVSQCCKDKRSVLALEEGNEVPGLKRPMSELRLKRLFCLPLVVEHEVLGCLYADGQVDERNTVMSRAVELFAEHVAVALDNARLFERANNDLLTGLPNNSYFLVQLTKVLREASPQRCGGVLLLDLDDFKRVNQAAGAEMGDRALIDIAHTLREVLRADGLVARYGSDKFAILLSPEESSIAIRMRDVAERARAAIGTKNYHGVALSACIGGAPFGANSKQTEQELVAVADNVLGKARARGAGQVEMSA